MTGTRAMLGRSRLISILAILSSGCALFVRPIDPSARAIDSHSFARPDEAVVRHLDLDLQVNFEKKEISGRARLSIENLDDASTFPIDTKDLRIHRVSVGTDERPVEFILGAEEPLKGQPLIVFIAPDTTVITVYYTTSPGAGALQWLDPGQTAAGRHPFLFTQSEPILARTWVPCQDTPSVRMTYRATVRVPPELHAVMSASNVTTKDPRGIYEFEMRQPIPSYLMALAVGDLEFRPLGERSGVFAEPTVVEKAAWEFADTERMMAATEVLYGPYRWDRYDLVVLPPSFPWGGMENPRLTFCTPTVLAGDRSLVSLIAHELAHSWSGNLVTNATWNDFWLNEGFTVYIEHRVMEEVYGTEYEDMLSTLDFDELLEEIEAMGPTSQDTRLRLDLSGRNPEEAMTAIAYIKGFFFLRTCEQVVGRDRWDAFLRGYFDTFAFQSMTSERFLAYLRRELLDKPLEEKIDPEAWVFGTGLPRNVVRPQSTALRGVAEELLRWEQGAAAGSLRTDGWSTHEWLYFLRKLPRPTAIDRMADLDKAFRMTGHGNFEIACEWLLLSIPSAYEVAYSRLETFLLTVGRLKFIKPLYQALVESPAGEARARTIYARARSGYHPLAVQALDKVLGL